MDDGQNRTISGPSITQSQQSEPRRLVLQTDEAGLLSAADETNNRWRAGDAVIPSCRCVLIYVKNVHRDLFFFGEPLQDRSSLLAKHSGGGMEVNEHRLIAFDDSFEFRRLHRLVIRRLGAGAVRYDKNANDEDGSQCHGSNDEPLLPLPL